MKIVVYFFAKFCENLFSPHLEMYTKWQVRCLHGKARTIKLCTVICKPAMLIWSSTMFFVSNIRRLWTHRYSLTVYKVYMMLDEKGNILKNWCGCVHICYRCGGGNRLIIIDMHIQWAGYCEFASGAKWTGRILCLRLLKPVYWGLLN